MGAAEKKPDSKTRSTRRAAANRQASLETEVKLRVGDRHALLRKLAALRAECEGRVHEMNTIYDTPARFLMRKGKLLRVRVERPMGRVRMSKPNTNETPAGALVTYKGPVRRRVPTKAPGSRKSDGRKYKVREEREIRVADGEQLAVILEGIGLLPSFRYEKYRSTYRLPGLDGVKLELDETPIGDFLEAEGSRAAIDLSTERLGYRPADYITESYWDLFRDAMRKRGRRNGSKRARKLAFDGSEVGNMLFRNKK
jgi:adenylate cyclase, class 2